VPIGKDLLKQYRNQVKPSGTALLDDGSMTNEEKAEQVFRFSWTVRPSPELTPLAAETLREQSETVVGFLSEADAIAWIRDGSTDWISTTEVAKTHISGVGSLTANPAPDP
jgi:hypothetical protein